MNVSASPMLSADLLDLLANRSRAAALLDALAGWTGDRRYSAAAGQLRRTRQGRQACKDDRALIEMAGFLAAHSGESPEAAARAVVNARIAAGAREQSALSAARRLARKYRANKSGAQNAICAETAI